MGITELTTEDGPLQPCPFCGMYDEDEIAIMTKSMQYPWEDGPHNVWSVGCSCGAYGSTGDSKEEAVHRWNTRKGN